MSEPVFFDRHLPSEALYFRLRGFGPHDVAVALSEGGAEMSLPTVELCGGRFRLLTEAELACDGVAGLYGEHVWVFDDGEAGDRRLCAAARLARRSGAASVRVAAAVASRRLQAMAGPGVIDEVTALQWREAVAGRPLFVHPPLHGHTRPMRCS